MRPAFLILALALGLAAGALPAQQAARSSTAVLRTERAETPVRLASAGVLVEAGAGVAQTTIDMTFANPNDRVLEGNLEFPLRPGQQVVGFALDVDGRMRDAVPVPKARARQVFESIERRGVDPGLLEQTQGEAFRLRIYPLPPRGERRVRIVLHEALARDAAGWSTTLLLQFAAGLERLVVDVRALQPPVLRGPLRTPTPAFVDGAYRYAFARGDVPAASGLTLQFPDAGAAPLQVQQHDGQRYVLAEVPAGAAAAPRTLPRTVGLLWDASMSGERRLHDLEFALLDAYFRAAGTVDVQLVRLRDRAEPVERFRVRGGDWSALRRALASTVYDGASNPAGWTPDASVGEYLLFGDGLFNYGDAPFPQLRAGQRLFAVHAGTGGDGARLAALADRHAGAALALRDAADLAGATDALLRDPPRLVELDGLGVADLVAESSRARDGVFRVAARLTGADARLRLRVADARGTRVIEVPVRDAIEGSLAARGWARYRLATLQAEPARHRAAIADIGQSFGMVTPETSLLVLERVEDYAEHGIAPPAELRDAWLRLQATRRSDAATSRQARLDAIAVEWEARRAWWTTPYPKGAPPRPERDAGAPTAVAAAEAAAAAADAAASAQARDATARHEREPMPAPAAPPPATELDRVSVTGSRLAEPGDAPPPAPMMRLAAGAAPGEAAASISLTPWRADTPEARRLREAPADAVYAVYLDERRRRAPGTAFFLDVADVLFEKGQGELALRVLSNLAEMELESRHVLRVLGYRLLQAGRADLAIPVLERVRDMAAEEPQSHRDLGLAYAAHGRRQDAVRALYDVVEGDWDARFPGVAQIALAELNAIAATAPAPLDLGFMDRRLRGNLPLALRAVLSWDSDNSDMDLWVTDPNGEKAYYGNRLTYQGGRMSNDFTGGYGPEEFALRDAKPGTYRVEANFFGDRQQLVTGATTLQLRLSTGFGTARQQDRMVTLRLRDERETVLVGEFEVK